MEYYAMIYLCIFSYAFLLLGVSSIKDSEQQISELEGILDSQVL